MFLRLEEKYIQGHKYNWGTFIKNNDHLFCAKTKQF